jgi:hypothetical protein
VLVQRGFGVQAPAVDPQFLYDIELQFPTGTVFDFWIDDVAFYQ